MNLFFHLAVHLSLAFLAGFLVFRIWRKLKISFLAGFLGGFLIDLDHFFDYFLAFGFDFDSGRFLAGDSFLKSDKIYIFFHGWEFILVFLVLAVFLKNSIVKSFCLALAIGMFFHLTADVFIDKVPPRTYFLLYRMKNNFELERLVYPEHWENHLLKKKNSPYGIIEINNH